jgi:hypothetical protein
MVAQDGIAGSAAVAGWSRQLGSSARAGRPPLRPLGSQGAGQALPPRSARPRRAQERLANGRGHRRARPTGGPAPLDSARWDADDVRDDLREYVVEHLGEEAKGVLIVDET